MKISPGPFSLSSENQTINAIYDETEHKINDTFHIATNTTKYSQMNVKIINNCLLDVRTIAISCCNNALCFCVTNFRTVNFQLTFYT